MRIIEDTLLEEVENVAIAIDSAIADGIIKNENINLFSKIKNVFANHKVNCFLKSSMKNEDLKFIDFFNSLSKKSKIFFSEAVNKAIDLNDNFQIYILGCLFESYEANSLNYFEKKLYYSLNSFSEDDFKIFWGIYKKYDDVKKEVELLLDSKFANHDLQDVFKDTEIQRAYPPILKIHEMGFVINDIIYSSLNRFVDIGVLTFVSKLQQKDENEYNPTDVYKINSYAHTLFNYLDIYCIANNIDYRDLLEVRKESNLENDWL